MKVIFWTLTLIISTYCWADIRNLPSSGSVTGIGTNGTVGSEGSFTTSSPISVPPGRNGLQPQVGLSYSSFGGNSELGLGWNFQVAKISKTPSKFRTYTSSLHGELTPLKEGYYRPAVLNKWVLYKKLNNEQWIIWDSEGKRYFFGGEGATEGSGENTVNWLLKTIKDPSCDVGEYNCNKIEYDYIKDDGGDFGTNQKLHLSKISYNFVGDQALSIIDFLYSPTRPDPIQAFKQGLYFQTSVLLQNIKVQHEKREILNVHLHYQEPVGDISFSTLKAITKITEDGSKYPTESFAYYGENPDQNFIPKIKPVRGIPRDYFAGRGQMIDISGDGRVDFFTQPQSGPVKISINSSLPNDEFVHFENSLSIENPPPFNLNQSQFIDLNGNGYWDIVSTTGNKRYVTNNGQYGFNPSKVDPSFPSLLWHQSFLMDIDGDGVTDALELSPTGKMRCWVNNANESWQNSAWKLSPLPNGVGPADPTTRLANINGDGFVDFIKVEFNGISINFNRGNCELSDTIRIRYTSSMQQRRALGLNNFMFSDLNSDGLADLYVISGKNVYYWLNLGSLNFSNENVFELPHRSVKNSVLDFDGDGLQDIFSCDVNFSCQVVNLFSGQKPGLMREVGSSQGDKKSIVYQSSVEQNHNIHSSPFIIHLASTITSTDGLTIPSTTHYSYSNPYFDPATRKLYGHLRTNSMTSQAQWKNGEAVHSSAPITSNQMSYFDISQFNSPLMRLAFAGQMESQTSSGGQFTKISRNFDFIDGSAHLRTSSVLKGIKLNQQVMAEYDVSEFNEFGFLKSKKKYASQSDQINSQVSSELISTTTVQYQANFQIPEKITDRFFVSAKSKKVFGKINNLLSEASYIRESSPLNRLIEEQTRVDEELWSIKKFVDFHKIFPYLSQKTVDEKSKLYQKSTFDQHGLSVTSRTNGEGETSLTTYDNAYGLLISSTDPNGLETKITYDGRGRIIQTEKYKKDKKYHESTRFYQDQTYGNPAQVYAVTWANEQKSRRQIKITYFNLAGDSLAEIVKAKNNQFQLLSSQVFDNRGNNAVNLKEPIFISCQNIKKCDYNKALFDSPRTVYFYDEGLRNIRIEWPLEQKTETLSYSIDANRPHLITMFIDKLGQRQDTFRDPFAQIVRKEMNTEQGYQIYQYEFDGLGQLLQVTQPSGKIRSYLRNFIGAIKLAKEDDQIIYKQKFNSRGSVKRQSWVSNNLVDFEYDNADRVTKKTMSNSQTGESEIFEYIYGTDPNFNSIGRVSIQSSQNVYDEFVYSPLGMILMTYRTLPKLLLKYTIENSFDWLGNLEKTNLLELKGLGGSTSPSSQIKYLYDSFGTLAAVPNYAEKIEFYTPTKVSSISLINGMKLSQTYQPEDLRISSVKFLIPHGADNLELHYQYDSMGNVKSIDGPLGRASYTYSNDPTYKLKNYEFSGISQNYSYDVDNSRNLDPGFERSAGAGNLTSDPKGNRYIFGPHRRLSTLYQSNGAHHKMAYDASGDLVYDISSESKVVHLNDHFKILDGKLYTYVDAAGKWIARSSSKDKIFMATNHIGTPYVHVDDKGSVIRKMVFTPFGKIQKLEGQDLALPAFKAMAGQFQHKSTGLYIMGARFYHPEAGQFIKLDETILAKPEKFTNDPLQLNLFQYAKNNPLVFVDPTGMYNEFYETTSGGYIRAGIEDLAHYVKYQADAAMNFVKGLGSSEPTGLGSKVSKNLGVAKVSARLGYDKFKGPEAFGEMSYNFGAMKGIGQLGYSNGGLRAIGRAEVPYGPLSGAASIGTSSDIRAKVGLGPVEVMYNSNMSGRVDFPIGIFYGISVGGYVNVNLTNESVQYFDQSKKSIDWSISGMPYGGASW